MDDAFMLIEVQLPDMWLRVDVQTDKEGRVVGAKIFDSRSNTLPRDKAPPESPHIPLIIGDVQVQRGHRNVKRQLRCRWVDGNCTLIGP